MNAARVAALSLALLASGCAAHMRFVCPAHGGPEWVELTSPHVVLRTDLDRPHAEAMLRELELMRALMAQALELSEQDTPERIEVVALASHEELADFIGKREYVGQALHDGNGRQRLLLAGLLTQDEQEVVVAHEMAHLVSMHALPYQPRWFAEGLATYLSSVARVAPDRSRAVGSTPQAWISNELRYERQATVRELMSWSGATEPARYAAAWLLIRTLAAEHAEAFYAFERRLATFEPVSKAWNASFPDWSLDRPGGPEALDAILKARAHDISGAGKKVAADLDVSIAARVLTPPEVHAARLDLSTQWKPDALRAELDEALREDPGHVLALVRRADEAGRGQALQLARSAVDAHPEDPAAWQLLARWLAPGDAERAAALRKAAELAPDRPEHLVALAEVLVDRDPAEAERLSARAVALAPWSARGLQVHATALAQVGRCEEPSSDLHRAQALQAEIDFTPTDWYAARRARLEHRCRVPAAARADPLVDAGFGALDDHPSRALALADEAAAADPDHPEAWLLRGNALFRLRRLREAEVAYRRQVQVHPSSYWGWNAMGAVQMRLGRTAEAEAAFRKQLEVEPTHARARTNLVNLLLDAGRPLEAVSMLEPLRKQAQRDPSLVMQHGRALLAAGDQRAGLAALEEAMKLAPGPSAQNDAAYHLAVANVQLPRASTWAESSVSGFADALSKRPGHEPDAREAAEVSSLVAAWDTLGWVRFRQGRLSEAERYVSTAVRLRESGEELEHLGEILDQKGLRTEAAAAYAEAVAADGNLAARRRLARLVPPADVERLMEAAQTALLRRRILRREPANAAAQVDAPVLLVLVADGTIAGVLPTEDGDLPGVAALRGTRHGIELPANGPGRLVVRGRYRCASGECAWFLGPDPVPEGPLPGPRDGAALTD